MLFSIPFFLFLLNLTIISSSSYSNNFLHDLDQVNFQPFLNQLPTNKPLLLEFYAPWCSHCRHFAPTYKQIAIDLSETATVARIDGSANPSLSIRFRIKGFPSFFLIHNNQVYKFAARRDYDQMVRFVQSQGQINSKKLDLFFGPLHPYWKIVSSLFIFVNKLTTSLLDYEKNGGNLALMVLAIVFGIIIFLAILLTIITTPKKYTNPVVNQNPTLHAHAE